MKWDTFEHIDQTWLIWNLECELDRVVLFQPASLWEEIRREIVPPLEKIDSIFNTVQGTLLNWREL